MDQSAAVPKQATTHAKLKAPVEAEQRCTKGKGLYPVDFVAPFSCS